MSARHNDIARTVQACIAEALNVDVENVSPAKTLLELGTDSLGFLEVVFCLDRTFQVTIDRWFAIPDEHTVADFTREVTRCIASQTSDP